MNWDILQRWNISIFIGKTSTLVKIFSLFPTSKRAQIQSKWRNWKFFHFGGKFSTFKNLQKKKKFFAELHGLEHSAEVENFPLLVEKFPLWWNFVFGI